MAPQVSVCLGKSHLFPKINNSEISVRKSTYFFDKLSVLGNISQITADKVCDTKMMTNTVV